MFEVSLYFRAFFLFPTASCLLIPLHTRPLFFYSSVFVSPVSLETLTGWEMFWGVRLPDPVGCTGPYKKLLKDMGYIHSDLVLRFCWEPLLSRLKCWVLPGWGEVSGERVCVLVCVCMHLRGWKDIKDMTANSLQLFTHSRRSCDNCSSMPCTSEYPQKLERSIC